MSPISTVMQLDLGQGLLVLHHPRLVLRVSVHVQTYVHSGLAEMCVHICCEAVCLHVGEAVCAHVAMYTRRWDECAHAPWVKMGGVQAWLASRVCVCQMPVLPLEGCSGLRVHGGWSTLVPCAPGMPTFLPAHLGNLHGARASYCCPWQPFPLPIHAFSRGGISGGKLNHPISRGEG